MKGQMTLGITASILAAFLFTVMDVSAKVLAPLGMGEITFIRGLAGLLFIPLIAMHEGKAVFSGKDRLLLHLRGLFGGFGILLFFYSLPGLKLGDAEILVQLSAFFMCILSPIFLHTPPSGKVLPWLVTIAAGAALVLQVWNFQAFNGYALLGVISSFCTASAYTCIGRLTEKRRPLGGGNCFLFPNLFYDRRRSPYGRSYGNAFRRGLGMDFLHVPVCPFCPGGSDLGMHPYTAGDCDLCHVHRHPFPHSGRLVPLGRETDSVFLDRRGGHRFRKRHAAVENKEELRTVRILSALGCIPEG